MTAAVERADALPAFTAVVAGRPTVGLNQDELERFLRRDGVAKVSARDLPWAMTNGVDGATTVAASLMLAAGAGVDVFATGGIGGVHHEPAFDESADLAELARTPIVVVCSGAKSILDLPATWERLESLGVPVVGYQTDELPGFYTAHTGIALERPGRQRRPSRRALPRATRAGPAASVARRASAAARARPRTQSGRGRRSSRQSRRRAARRAGWRGDALSCSPQSANRRAARRSRLTSHCSSATPGWPAKSRERRARIEPNSTDRSSRGRSIGGAMTARDLYEMEARNAGALPPAAPPRRSDDRARFARRSAIELGRVSIVV